MQHRLFYWSSNILTGNSSLLVLFIAITHANSKYRYHLWTFKFLKYSYQKRIEGVIRKEKEKDTYNSPVSLEVKFLDKERKTVEKQFPYRYFLGNKLTGKMSVS